MPYRDMWSPSDSRQRKETLINVRSRGGEEHIFRVPIRFLHRVRERGAWVTVEYLPGTERVLDVRYADAPSDVAEHQM